MELVWSDPRLGLSSIGVGFGFVDRTPCTKGGGAKWDVLKDSLTFGFEFEFNAPCTNGGGANWDVLNDWSTFGLEFEFNALCAKGRDPKWVLLNDEPMDRKAKSWELQVNCEGRLGYRLVEWLVEATSLPCSWFDIYNNHNLDIFPQLKS